jgi:hypothetical protein
MLNSGEEDYYGISVGKARIISKADEKQSL